MKKVFFMVMAVAAIGFSSCGNKTQNVETVDSTEVVSSVVEEAKTVTEQLQTKIEAGDSKAINEVIETATAKVKELIEAGDLEAAKQYQEQIKAFVTENADKIKAAVNNDETVTKLVDSFINAPVEIEKAINEAGENLNAAGEKAVEEAKAAGEKAVNDMKSAAEQKIEEEKQKATDAAEQKIEDAKQKAKSMIIDATDNLRKKR